MFDQIGEAFAVDVVNIIIAVLILVIGWIVALIIAAGVRGAIRRTRLSERLGKVSEDEEGTKTIDLERWLSKAVFYVVMLFVLIAFFQYLDLTIVAEPFNELLTQVFYYLPMVFGALVLLFVAWVIATILRVIILRVLVTAKVDERLGDRAGIEEEKRLPLSQVISKAAYWIVFLLFLPAILTALQLEGLLLPVQNMTDTVLSYLPQVLAAVLIAVAGWFLARILYRIVSGLLAAAGTDGLSERLGVSEVMGEQKLSNLFGWLVYALVIIVTVIAALNALALEAITQPASNMLNMILEALPVVFAAVLILVIAYVVARVVKGLLSNVLKAAGFNAILSRLGIAKEGEEGRWTPSEAAGYIALVVIMLFAVIEAAGVLGFTLLAQLVSQLLTFISHVVLGLIIFGIGLYLANLAYRVISAGETSQASFLAKVARYAILIFAGAIALQRMGLADEIILLAFGILFGTLAITVILAFGVGGKEIAARELDEWIKHYKSKQ